MRHFCRSLSLTVAFLLAAAATPAHAQFAQESVVASPSTTAAGPTVDGATAGVRSAPTAESRTSLEAALRQDREPRMGRNVALMVVGGAALITGLIIGDDAGAVIAVSGAIIGLYGLYNFVK